MTGMKLFKLEWRNIIGELATGTIATRRFDTQPEAEDFLSQLKLQSDRDLQPFMYVISATDPHGFNSRVIKSGVRMMK